VRRAGDKDFFRHVPALSARSGFYDRICERQAQGEDRRGASLLLGAAHRGADRMGELKAVATDDCCRGS
jgi:hypothetical protein